MNVEVISSTRRRLDVVSSSGLPIKRIKRARSRDLNFYSIVGATDDSGASVTKAKHWPDALRWSAAGASYSFLLFFSLTIVNALHLWPLWLPLSIASAGVAISNALRLNTESK